MSWKFLFMIFRKVTQISSRKKSVIRWNHCFEDVFEFTNQRSGFILSSNVPILPNTMKTFVKRSFQKEWNSIWKALFQMQHVYVDFFLCYAMTLIGTSEQKHKVNLFWNKGFIKVSISTSSSKNTGSTIQCNTYP